MSIAQITAVSFISSTDENAPPSTVLHILVDFLQQLLMTTASLFYPGDIYVYGQLLQVIFLPNGSQLDSC